jgi:hypothetical protein
MKLIEVRNGHYFVKKSDPCRIFKRIQDITLQYIHLQDRSASRVHIEAILVNDGCRYTFKKPQTIEVIGLGK